VTTALPSSPTAIRIDHRDPTYGEGFFDKLQQGQAVAGKDGYTWQHDGQGWTQQQGGAAPPAAGGSDPYTPSPAAGGGQTVPGQAAAGQTYSGTPGAAPAANTTNQAAQDVVRNSYLERAAKPIEDPRARADFRTVADTHAAATERARRDATADLAEGMAGTGQTGAQSVESRLIAERAAQQRGNFEADLVRQDLQQQRADVENALKALTGMIDADQTRALQQKLADLDAQLKTASLNASTGLGSQELALKDRLGMAGINVDLLGKLLQNQQFNNNLGFEMGDREAYWNNAALNQILGGL
jgi:hypothetical protein